MNAEDPFKAKKQMLELFAEESRKAGMVRDTQFVDIARFPLPVRLRLKELYRLSNSCQEGVPMNIFAQEGDQVCYHGTGCGGREEDKSRARQFLKKGEIYTVQTTFVNDSYSFVMLQEIPGEIFCTFFLKDLYQ